MNELALETATATVDSAVADGARRQHPPLCVVILDRGWRTNAPRRMGKTSRLRPPSANATGCLGMGSGALETARCAPLAPAFPADPDEVLVRNAAGALPWAVRVSAKTSDNDETVAVTGVGAGLPADAGAAKDSK